MSMKQLDVDKVHEAIDLTIQALHEKENQMHDVEVALNNFVNLEDAFRGQGGQAIRNFYATCHIPFIQFFRLFMHDYEHTLQQLKQSLDIVEPASGGFIDQAFIENDVQDGLDRVSKTTMALTDSVNDTLRSIQDIISIPLIDDSDVQQAIHVAKRESNAVVDKVLQFDHSGTASLQSIKESLRTLSKYVMEMHGAMDSGHLSVKGFSVDQLQHLPSHGTLTEVLENRASQVAELTGSYPKQRLNVLDRTTLDALARIRYIQKMREQKAKLEDIYHSAVNLGKEYIPKGFGYLKDGYRFLTKIHGKKITVDEENYDWCGEHGCYRLDDYDRELVGNMWLLSKNGKTDQEAAQATEAFNEALANGDLVLESHHGDVDIYAEQARAAREGYNLWTGEEISEEMADLTIFTSVTGTLTGMFYAGRGLNRVPTRNLDLPSSPQKNKNSNNNNVNTNINSNQSNNINSPGAPYRNQNANNIDWSNPLQNRSQIIQPTTPSQILQNKPKYSPTPQRWGKKGGKVEIDENGTWIYTNKKGQSVSYPDGYPDFTHYSHPTVKPVEITIATPTNRRLDYKEANLKAGLNKNSDPPVPALNEPPKGYVWHHHQDGKTMILVEEKIHTEFTHVGGVSTVNGKY
ncbi:HNH endonuclease [Bacillus sp. A301a_S52]|nr:HNH endonuclease [Bacillus sp. A301a_S52]